jgi:hypothetical protein
VEDCSLVLDQTLKVRKRKPPSDNAEKFIFALQWTLSYLTEVIVLQLASGLDPCVKGLFCVRDGVVFQIMTSCMRYT